MSQLASFQTPNLASANEGSRAAAYTFDFTLNTILAVDLGQTLEMDQHIAFIQSVYLDNADNSAPVDVIFLGGPTPQRIRCPAFGQGWFPVSWPIGSTRLTALGGAGMKVNAIFANYAMPYMQWGPQSGITVTPALINVAFQPLNFAGAGSQQLVAGVAAQSVLLYRGMFESDQPVVLKWQDGNGGATLFSALLTAGGSATFQASGIPWFATTAGNGLYLNASAACNIYGGFGYAQH